MPAHVPRTLFAAPLVVTFACGESPPAKEPTTTTTTPPPSATPSATAAPASATPATVTKVDVLWKISYDGTKKECMATRETNKTAPCPPGEKCDGPPVP